MEMLIAYSSKTGNTRRVAEAMAEALGAAARLVPVGEADPDDPADGVAVGCWIDRGRPDKAAARFLKRLKNRNVALFFTLGADPGSDHALRAYETAKALVGGNRVVGHFVCQGRIDPALKAWMLKLPRWFPHGPNPERIARWERADPHPDENDLEAARAEARKWLAALRASAAVPSSARAD